MCLLIATSPGGDRKDHATAARPTSKDVQSRPWFVYLLVCRGECIYCGVTPDLARRIEAHRNGKGAKFTRINPPERLLAVKSCSGKIVAMQLEARIKRMKRVAKLALAAAWLREESVEALSARCVS